MYFVYILLSVFHCDRFYAGLTDNINQRLTKHNDGKFIHTNKYKPWKIKTCVGFSNLVSAQNLEKYLKTSSGGSFAKKRL